MPNSSSIFRPFRSLGLVSSDVSFAVKYKPRNKEFNIAVPVGERFNIYKLPNLKLVGISDCLPSDIQSFTSDKSLIYAAANTIIYAFRGLRHVAFKLEGHNVAIVQILAFGDNCLASYDEGGTFIVWDLRSKEQICRDELPIESFVISAMLHPSNYKDKLLFGSVQGPLRLWNVASRKLIYWFKGFDSPVTCLAQSPAEDVCAIGLGNGRIMLHNLRYDTTLISVRQDGGAITSIDFRSDTVGLTASEALVNAGIVASDHLVADPQANIFLLAGSASGQLVTWQLEADGNCRTVNQEEELHLARIVSMFCIPTGEAAGALVTCGADNCIKVSFFDRPDGGPRMGHVRSGHFLPPNKIAFWTGGSAGGNLLVSAGQDSQMRIFSTFNERFDKNLGRGYAPGVPSKKKVKGAKGRSAWLLPGATQLAMSSGRAHDWDSMSAVHAGRREVTTWNFVKATRGKHWLDPKKFHGMGGEALRVHKNTIATSLCMTKCGNFVVIGYSSGDVIKFNIQSGLEYGSYGEPIAHNSSIFGVHVNNVNRVLVTVGEIEVRFWNFAGNRSLIATLSLDDGDGTTTTRFSKFHDDSDVLAVAKSSGEVVLINVLSRVLFRRFANPPSQPCVDLAISSDGTLLVTAHRGDALIKTWDIVDCKLVDCFRVHQPVTSLAFSPSDDLLATTHSACLGVYLWDNRATYQRLHLKPLPADFVPDLDEVQPVPTQSLSAPRFPDDDAEEDMEVDQEEEEEEEDERYKVSSTYLSPDQLQDKLVTLSGLPTSYFKAFLQLDAIKRRNAEALAAPEDVCLKLPFFLPVVEATTGIAWMDEDDNTESATLPTLPARRKRGGKQIEVGEILVSHLTSVLGDLSSLQLTDGVCDAHMERLKALNPSALDMEIRLMAPARDELVAMGNAIGYPSAVGDPYARLSAFLRLIRNRFQRNLDVDFATACLESVLRRHGDIIARPPSNIDILKNEEADFGKIVSTEEGIDPSSSNAPFLLVEQTLGSKRIAQASLFAQITRSIALIDFVRNATCTLQM